MSKFKPGDKIKVKIGKKSYKTHIDEHGVQRFKANSLIRWLVDSKRIDLNDIALHFATSKNAPFTKRDYAEFNMMLGYSVCGFADLSFFNIYNIENPCWDKEENEL